MINNQITQMGCGGVIGPSKLKEHQALRRGKFEGLCCPYCGSSVHLLPLEFNHVCSMDFISFFSFVHIWKQPNLSSYANTSKCSHDYNLHMCM